MVDQRLQVGAHGAELGGTDVERLTRSLRLVPRSRDRVDEILDREQLVAVVALTERVDPAPLADPIEEDLEHAQALLTDEGLGAHYRRLDRGNPAESLRVDLRLAVPSHPDERIVLLDRMLLRHAVDRGRG